MRNWNMYRVFKLLFDNPCFYSTYEELKLPKFIPNTVCPPWFLQYLWGIETLFRLFVKLLYQKFLQYLWGIETYFSVYFIGRYVVRFYSTYEELKPAWPTKPPTSPLAVFTVPMRNWNWQLDMETWKELLNVFTVPMRNWNPPSRVKVYPQVPCFYSTYEELKPIWTKIFRLFFLSFYSTYEELKLIGGS